MAAFVEATTGVNFNGLLQGSDMVDGAIGSAQLATASVLGHHIDEGISLNIAELQARDSLTVPHSEGGASPKCSRGHIRVNAQGALCVCVGTDQWGCYPVPSHTWEGAALALPATSTG